MSCLRLLCALTGAWLLASSLTLAQTATSIIHGNVRDGNGASLVNAAVTATLTGANSVYRAVTNAEGNHIIPGVRPGQYTISFDLPGFRKAERAGVRLEVSNTDIAAQKHFRVTESKSVEFRWEDFNLFNRPNFTNPNTAFCLRTSSACNFGRILSARDPRIMQVGLKLKF